MEKDIKISPTPIQRNRRDVAIELIGLYFKYSGQYTSDEITDDKLCELYDKFYRQARESEK